MWTVAAEGSGRPWGPGSRPSPAPARLGHGWPPWTGASTPAGGLTGGEATADVEAFDPLGALGAGGLPPGASL